MFTSGIIEPYAWGYLVTLNLMLAWEATPLRTHLLNGLLRLTRGSRYKREVFTVDDFNNHVGDHWGLLGELLVCPICLSHWIGALVSAATVLILGAPLYIIPLCFLTYPVLVYWVLKKLLY